MEDNMVESHIFVLKKTCCIDDREQNMVNIFEYPNYRTSLRDYYLDATPL
jgi:hypothetical protein